MRQFTSLSQLVVCLKGSATLRAIDVEGDVQYYNRKNQDHTGPIRATWWNMLADRAKFRGAPALNNTQQTHIIVRLLAEGVNTNKDYLSLYL